MQYKMPNLESEVVPSRSLPAPAKPSQPKKSPWVEPTLGPGELGGIVADRSDLQAMDEFKWKKGHPPLAAKMFYSPRFGKFYRWFDVALQSTAGEQIVSLHEDELYNLTYGDWVTVKKFTQDAKQIIGHEIEVIKTEPDWQMFDLDAHWIGPAFKIEAEGKVGKGVDENGRILLFEWQSYRSYFGGLRKRKQKIQVKPFDAVQHLGGTLYDILGLAPPPPPKTDTEVKAAYRLKAKETHPDANPGDSGAGARFQEVVAAYDILETEVNRKRYALLLSMATSTYTGNKVISDIEVKEGQWPEAWYPGITSGEARVKARQIGTNLLIKEIKTITEVTNNHLTRVCTYIDGLTTLLWKE